MVDTANVSSLGSIDRDELDVQLTRLFASDPGAMAEVEPLWHRLRSEAPVHRHGNALLFSTSRGVKKIVNDPRAHTNIWAVGRRADAIRAALPPDGQHAFDEISAFEAMYMSRNDGEAHARLRRIAQRTFTPRRIGQIGDVIERTANEYLDRLPPGGVVDFVPFAYALPLKIIGDLLAIPEADLDRVHGWSSKLGRNRGGAELAPLLAAHQALGEFRSYVEGVIDQLRVRPRSSDDIDLIGDLLEANEGERLDDAELVAMFVVLLFAGHETTTNLIATGLLSLLREGQWAVLCERPELIPSAVDELVRFVSPVQWIGRYIVEPMEVDGHQLEAGETVLLMLGAANRDPELFPDPDVLDVERANSQYHLGFGRGAHICLGSHLARLEAISTLTIMARRFPDLRLADVPIEWTGNAALRSLRGLPLVMGDERVA